MVQANHHLKSKCLASDQPFKNGTILSQNIKSFGIEMALGFPSSVFESPLYNIKDSRAVLVGPSLHFSVLIIRKQ